MNNKRRAPIACVIITFSVTLEIHYSIFEAHHFEIYYVPVQWRLRMMENISNPIR